MIRYIYILRMSGHRWRFKIGIAGNVADRIRRIEYDYEAATGERRRVRCFFRAPLIFPLWAEKRAHGVLSAMRVDMPVHSGHTEWFRTRNYAAAGLFLWAAFSEGWDISWWYPFVLIFAPLPLDGLLVVLAVVAFEWALVGLSVYGVLFGLSAFLQSL